MSNAALTIEEWASRGIEPGDATTCRHLLRGLQLALADARLVLVSLRKAGFPADDPAAIDFRRESRRDLRHAVAMRRRLAFFGCTKH